MRFFAVIPAAGRSERMGTPKLLLPWGNRKLIEHVLEVWREGGVEHRIVVARHDDESLISICRDAGAIVCVPPTPPPEMKDSVAAALVLIEERFNPTSDDAWLLAPADLPLLSAQLIRRLQAEFQSSTTPVVVPRLPDGRTGHPVLFSWSLASKVPRLTNGVKELLASEDIRYVPWQSSDDFRDVDIPDDYHSLWNRYIQTP